MDEQADLSLLCFGYLFSNNLVFISVMPLSSEDIDKLSGIKNSIANLYSQLNVGEHQLMRESDIRKRLEEYKRQIAPMEKVRIIL